MLTNTFKKHQPLSLLTRIKTGGSAAFFAFVSNTPEIQKAIAFSQKKQLPYYILGNGSNVLISDNNFNGVVIKLVGEFTSICFDYGKRTVTAGAGSSLMNLGHMLAKKGYMGRAYMGVIPGTVGGAICMNAGISAGEAIGNSLQSVLMLEPESSQTKEYYQSDLNFDYRKSSILHSEKIILQATLNLPGQKEASNNQAMSVVKELIRVRRLIQPSNPHTFGSTFKNPVNSSHSAGWHLERVGMKGLRIGGAMVAEEHANWILNEANAKSKDVKELIETGKKRVFEKFGINLEREVVYLPEDMNFTVS